MFCNKNFPSKLTKKQKIDYELKNCMGSTSFKYFINQIQTFVAPNIYASNFN